MRERVVTPPAKPQSSPTARVHDDASLERDADRVADAVLDPQSRGAADRGFVRTAAPIGDGGRPLPHGERHFYESRFGWDLANVRIHSNAQAADSVGALAYATGSNIVLGADAPALETNAGRRLIAHELAHVIQQHRQCPPAGIQRWESGKQPIRPVSTVVQGEDDVVSVQGHPCARIHSTNGPLRRSGSKQDAFGPYVGPARAGVSLAYSVTLHYENPEADLQVAYLPGKKDLATNVFPAVDINVYAFGDLTERTEKDVPPIDFAGQSRAIASQYTQKAKVMGSAMVQMEFKAQKLESSGLSRAAIGAFGLTMGTIEPTVSLVLDVADDAVENSSIPLVGPVIGPFKTVYDISQKGPEVRAIGRHASESVDVLSGKTNEVFKALSDSDADFSKAFKAFWDAKIDYDRAENYVDAAPHLGRMAKA
ncbi:MAG TPA: DUF4157 domain-containing protein, partial [Kofleriaceae bacterium]